MNILLEEHQEFITALLKGKVDFMLVGGLAVIYYGYPRITGDLDLWLKPANTNKKKLLSVLKHEGIDEDDLNYLESLDFTEHHAFHIGSEPLRIDFLTRISGVEYPVAEKMMNYFTLGDHKIPIIHLNHLIISKLSSSRAKDKADIEELQKVSAIKKDP